MMNLTICNPTAKDMCLFLADYAGWLFSSGATCIRLEKNVGRIAEVAGMTVELAIMPRHIHLTVNDAATGEIFTSIATIVERPISYDINTRLSRLSWDIADRKIGIVDGMRMFKEIVAMPGNNPTVTLLLASVANASFCRLFGGDIAAMAVVLVATMAGFYLKQQLSARKVDFRLTVVASSFVSAVLAAADGLFQLGATPDISIGTSVLYLVPGIPFINSFCDMIDRHYVCAMSRFMNASVITCCLSVGLFVGMMLMNVGMF